MKKETTHDNRLLSDEERKQLNVCRQLWNRINKFVQKSSYRNRKNPVDQKDIDKMIALRRKYIEERDKLRSMGIYEIASGWGESLVKDNLEARRSD